MVGLHRKMVLHYNLEINDLFSSTFIFTDAPRSLLFIDWKVSSSDIRVTLDHSVLRYNNLSRHLQSSLDSSESSGLPFASPRFRTKSCHWLVKLMMTWCTSQHCNQKCILFSLLQWWQPGLRVPFCAESRSRRRLLVRLVSLAQVLSRLRGALHDSRVRLCRFLHCNWLGPNGLASPLPVGPRKGLFRGRLRRGLIKGRHRTNHAQKVLRSFYAARRTRRRREILLFILQKAPIGLQKVANLEASANFNRASQEVPFRQWTLD